MITDSFDPVSEEILKASEVPGYAGGPSNVQGRNFPETVIMTFSERAENLVREKYSSGVICSLMPETRIPVYEVSIPDELVPYERKSGASGSSRPERAGGTESPTAFFRTGIGAPYAASMLEEIIARGGRKFIVFGSCGVLDDVAEGHIIAPTESYRDEGTSYHYAAPADYITIRNAHRVAAVMGELSVPCIQGRIWTTDGLYRETRRNAQARRSEGCIAVDMECSVLQAVCDLRDCELYQFVYAEDSLAGGLSGGIWDPRGMGQGTSETMDIYVRIALALAVRV